MRSLPVQKFVEYPPPPETAETSCHSFYRLRAVCPLSRGKNIQEKHYGPEGRGMPSIFIIIVQVMTLRNRKFYLFRLVHAIFIFYKNCNHQKYKQTAANVVL